MIARAAGSTVAADIMVLGDVIPGPTPCSVPDVVPMVKGVLKGFPNVKITTCDIRGTPSGSLICRQPAVQAKVDAVLLGWSAGAQDLSVLNKARIPIVGSPTVDTPHGYPTVEAYSLYVAIGVGLHEAGCTKLGIIYIDGSDSLVDYTKAGFENSGGKEVARAAVPANSADVTPAVAKLTGAGAECVAVSLAPSGAAQALTALKQSSKSLLVGSGSSVFSPQLLASLGLLGEGLLVVDGPLNPADDAPGLATAQAAMTSVDSSTKLDQQAVAAYVAAKVVDAAWTQAKGDVDPASMIAALDGLRDVDMSGVVHPWSSIPLPSKTFARVFHHYGNRYVIKNGKPVKQGDFYDTSAVLNNM